MAEGGGGRGANGARRGDEVGSRASRGANLQARSAGALGCMLLMTSVGGAVLKAVVSNTGGGGPGSNAR